MYRDRWIWIALVVGFALRAAPMLLWPMFDCVRDECIYRKMGEEIINGQGLTLSEKGWLPAPAYPYLLAMFKLAFGSFSSIKWLQVLVGSATTMLVGDIAHRVWRMDGDQTALTAARWAAFLYALHPTLGWFTNTLWIETFYIAWLLLAVWGVLWARDGSWKRAAMVGCSVGMCMLFKGVATYLAPIFLLALVWPEDGSSWASDMRTKVKQSAVMLAALVVTVLPWTIQASQRHGGLVVSDVTIGHVAYLGNNDFPPLTFDYGNGMLTGALYADYLRTGRVNCDRSAPVTQSSRCEVKEAITWIEDHPRMFVRRIPMRLAQQLNPNSFLTRHLRWGFWPSLPWWAKEALCLLIVLSTVFTVLGGTAVACARAKGPYALMATGTIAYTMLAAAVLYGMTRFRLPLEPLLLIWLAGGLARPQLVFHGFIDSPWRSALLMVLLPVLSVLMWWYLPTGFPMFWV